MRIVFNEILISFDSIFLIVIENVSCNNIVNLKYFWNEFENIDSFSRIQIEISKSHIDFQTKKFDFRSKKNMLQTTNYDDVFKFVKTYWQRLFEIIAKYYHFIVEKNDFIHIANVKKNTIDDEYIEFSLHENFVSKNQFRNFEKSRSICIFFDVANAFVIEIQKNFKSNVSNFIVIEKNNNDFEKNYC